MGEKKGRFVKQWPLFVMMAFPALLLLIYSYGPMFGLVMVFQRFEPARGFFRSAWIGLGNFRRVFAMPDLWQITFNSFFIAVMKIFLGTVAAILTAILLNELTGTLFKRTIQTVIYAPYFLSWVILGGVFRELLSRDGLLNMGLGLFGTEPVNFLGAPAIFPWVLISTELWQMTGFNAIIYLAAIIGIDPTLYEAAAIDGAGRVKQILKIMLPGIMSYIILMAVLNMGYILNAGFEQILMLYSPSVYSTGDVIDTWVYRAGLVNAQYSLASTVGLLRSLVGFVLITFSYWLAKKKWNYSIF
ncbi:MAG: ABC transporter permease subunit [Treponema sp.]|jgi:putative aldouronate transport system permease protein|nr:ABC transporter permease subunit [Treponema sp.]